MNLTDHTPSSSRRSFVRNSVLTTGALAIGLPALSGGVAAKGKGKARRPGTVPVFADDIDGSDAIFYRIAQAGNAGDTFVKGPGKAPFGAGSLQLTTTGPSDRLILYNYDYGTFDVDSGTESNTGVRLADITELQYSTHSNDDTLVPALKTEIDPDGPVTSGVDDYATLNFEPYYNHTVTPGTWQTWDVLSANAGLWLTGVSGEGSIAQPVTWDRLLELYPDAAIRFGFGIGVGSGWSLPSFVGHVDDLRIGIGGRTTRYNFEARGKGRGR